MAVRRKYFLPFALIALLLAFLAHAEYEQIKDSEEKKDTIGNKATEDKKAGFLEDKEDRKNSEEKKNKDSDEKKVQDSEDGDKNLQRKLGKDNSGASDDDKKDGAEERDDSAALMVTAGIQSADDDNDKRRHKVSMQQSFYDLGSQQSVENDNGIARRHNEDGSSWENYEVKNHLLRSKEKEENIIDNSKNTAKFDFEKESHVDYNLYSDIETKIRRKREAIVTVNKKESKKTKENDGVDYELENSDSEDNEEKTYVMFTPGGEYTFPDEVLKLNRRLNYKNPEYANTLNVRKKTKNNSASNLEESESKRIERDEAHKNHDYRESEETVEEETRSNEDEFISDKNSNSNLPMDGFVKRRQNDDQLTSGESYQLRSKHVKKVISSEEPVGTVGPETQPKFKAKKRKPNRKININKGLNKRQNKKKTKINLTPPKPHAETTLELLRGELMTDEVTPKTTAPLPEASTVKAARNRDDEYDESAMNDDYMFQNDDFEADKILIGDKLGTCSAGKDYEVVNLILEDIRKYDLICIQQVSWKSLGP